MEILKEKIDRTDQLIAEWYEYFKGKVYVAFSGGKDSTVLLHLVRRRYPDVPAVFLNTGMEYPEILRFVRRQHNVIILRPKMYFYQIVKKYGYPVISKQVAWKIYEARNTKSLYQRNRRLLEKNRYGIPKRYRTLIAAPFPVSDKCCRYMKLLPSFSFQSTSGRLPYIGTMAAESKARQYSYEKHGCNAYGMERPVSRPMMEWDTWDVFEYCKIKQVEICDIYRKYDLDRTGCMCCGFGIHLEKEPNRFQKMKKTHPRQWHYIIKKLGMGKVFDFIGVPYE